MVIVSVTEFDGTVSIKAGEGVHSEMFSVSKKLWREYVSLRDLAEGDEINEEIYDELKLLDEKTEALHAAVRMIAAADRSLYYIKQKLKIKGFSDDASEYALEALEKDKTIDEDSICMRVAEREVRSKCYGKRRIAAYLLSHGYRRSSVNLAIDSIPDSSFEEAIDRIIEKKYSSFSDDSLPREEKAKIFAALSRLGFTGSEIYVARDRLKKTNG